MSELVITRQSRIRLRLLATVSSIAMIASVCASGAADAEPAGNRPVLWVELGVSSDRVYNSENEFALPVGSLVPPNGFTGPLVDRLNLSRSQTEGGSITFLPSGSDWVFSASVTYGRSHGMASAHQAAPNPATSFITYQFTYPFFPSSNKLSTKPLPQSKFSAAVRDSESHLILDFRAGKDVGLGLFGHGSTSALSAGVRFAHFIQSRRINNFQETNGIHFQSSTFMTNFWPGYGTNRRAEWTTIAANDSATQSFAGLGPSVSWQASIPVTGNENHGGEFLLDWGLNAAVIFGKQTKKEEHKSSSAYNCSGRNCAHVRVPYAPQSSASRSSKNATVPNLGGYVGLSLLFSDAKVNLGYRADFFFGAMDAGIARYNKEDIGFHGPYASISIGIGD